jgi:ribonucleoside-diphosphate reductase alpha chain
MPQLDEPQLSANALETLKARYLLRAPDGEIDETPAQLFGRVARAIADAELRFGSAAQAGAWEERFLAAMTRLEFLPNSPTLMNAGTPMGQLSACFVLPIEDSIDGIFTTLRHAALVHQTGGGTGFNFSAIRPAGDQVGGAVGVASGALSFLRVFNAATEAMRQGGKRRGANMGILNADHPEIEAFIAAKRESGALHNFNLSVGVPDAFMAAVATGADWPLRNPRTRAVTATRKAPELFRRICDAAWATGDPGVVFLDAIERANPTPKAGTIRATNPCGEVPLLPYESCNLGSINLARCLRRSATGYVMDWDKLRELVRLGVRFLDNVVEINRYPIPEVDRMVLRNRKIGLGVMGLAEALIHLGLSYESPAAVETGAEIARVLRETADEASADLAAERGVFPGWSESVFAAAGRRVRNATVLSIAPTGTISLIAGTTSGIEPLFGVAFTRSHVLGGRELPEVSPLFAEAMSSRDAAWQSLIPTILKTGSVQGVADVPEEVQRLFRCALDIAPLDHLRMQAAFQAQVDNGVSKTVNLPFAATVEDVETIYREGHRMGLKGVTVFRYGSRSEQVLSLGATPHDERFDLVHLTSCDAGSCRI